MKLQITENEKKIQASVVTLILFLFYILIDFQFKRVLITILKLCCFFILLKIA